MGILSKRFFPTILLALVSVAGAPLSSSGATPEADRVVGVWNLNIAKSKFLSSPPPKSQTRIYENHADGIKATIETTYADGKSTTIQYIASYDSVEYPISGSLQFDAIAMKKINALTAEASLSHAGKEIANVRRVISEDGLTMTVTFRRMNVTGGEVTNIWVFDKEALPSEIPVNLN
jgi:hypothetical protein